MRRLGELVHRLGRQVQQTAGAKDATRPCTTYRVHITFYTGGSMQSTQVRTLDAGRRVEVFLDTQAAALGKAVSPTLRAKLDDAVTQLGGFQIEQATAKGTALGETTNQVALREELYQTFMVQIGRTAKVALRQTPEYPNLVVPSGARRKLDFVARANQFADAAAKHEAVIVEHGMPTDFLAQLKAAIAGVVASADARERSLSRRKAATAGAVTADKAVRTSIGLIDGVVKPLLKKNTSLLADWQASKLIRALPVTPLPTGGIVVAPAPTPATTSAPALETQPPKAA